MMTANQLPGRPHPCPMHCIFTASRSFLKSFLPGVAYTMTEQSILQIQVEAGMKSCILWTLLAVSLFSWSPAARAASAKADAYLGYSRAGANLYGPYTRAMNGWQLAVHVKPMPFLGVEGDVSHYSADAGAGSQQVTLVMFGPRVTVHAAGVSLFAHGLGGFGHLSSNVVPGFPAGSTNSASYALGGGGDLPLIIGLKLRITGDYLGSSNAPSSDYSPSHYRFGAGIAYHF